MADRPNVLLIICDQMTARLTSAYGHPVVRTPNLDRLVREGARFDNAYSSCPVCVPARSSLMTGKYVSRTGCYDNGSMFPSDEPTLCHYLSLAGCDTTASGKLHFIGPDQLHGFERRLTTDFHPSDFTFLPLREAIGGRHHAGFHKNPIASNYITAGVRQWSPQLSFDEETHFRALEYLRLKRSQYTGTLQKELPKRDERPFFLCVSYCHPHEPFHVTEDLWALYENEEIELPKTPPASAPYEHAMDRMVNRFHGTNLVNLDDKKALYTMRRAYYGLVTYVDRKVGELIKALEDFGLMEQTAIVFTSDHGDMLGERRMVQKRCFYEYSAQIPLIIHYPKNWPAATTIPEAVSTVDIMPTILDMVGVPEKNIVPIDGKSLIPLIEGERDGNRTVFSEVHSEGVDTTCFMAKKGEFKYIQTTGHEAQFYDLGHDTDEWTNLSGQPAYRSTEQMLREAVMANFNPTSIEQDVQQYSGKHWLLKRAMRETGLPKWDYQPQFDATEQFWREYSK